MTAPDDTAAALIQGIKDNAQRLGLSWQLTQATVVDASSPESIVVAFDGDESLTPGVITMVPVSAGARVYVMQVPPAGAYIVGYAAPAALATVNLSCVFTMPSQTKSNAIYAAVLGAGSVAFAVSIQKKFKETALRCDAAGTFYSGTSASGVVFGVQADGVTGADSGAAGLALANHQIGGLSTANATLNAHTPWGGHTLLPDLDAGLVTISLWWKRHVGTGVITMDASDFCFLTVSEVWPA